MLPLRRYIQGRIYASLFRALSQLDMVTMITASWPAEEVAGAQANTGGRIQPGWGSGDLSLPAALTSDEASSEDGPEFVYDDDAAVKRLAAWAIATQEYYDQYSYEFDEAYNYEYDSGALDQPLYYDYYDSDYYDETALYDGEELLALSRASASASSSIQLAEGGEVPQMAEGGEVQQLAEGGEVQQQAEGGEVQQQAEGGEVQQQADGGEVLQLRPGRWLDTDASPV